MTDDQSRHDPDGATKSEPAEKQGKKAAGKAVGGKGFGAALTFASLAFVAAVVFGVLWLTTSNSEAHAVAEGRDQVVEASKDAITAFTAVDPKNVDAVPERQKSVSTKKMYDVAGKDWTQTRDRIVKSNAKLTTKILDAGVYELDVEEGKATAIAAVEFEVSVSEARPQTGRVRMMTHMERAQDGSWKIAQLDRVPEVGASQ